MDVARRWGTFILWLCSPAPNGASGGSPEQAAQGPRWPDLVLLQTHHPAANVQEGSPSLPSSLTQVFQLEVSGLSATEGAGRWVKCRRSAALGAGHGSSPSRRAIWLSLPERPKRDCTCGLRPLMHPWSVRGVRHIWFQEAVSCPWARPLDRHAHGTRQLLREAVGCCLPESGETPRRRCCESQGAAASHSPMPSQPQDPLFLSPRCFSKPISLCFFSQF